MATRIEINVATLRKALKTQKAVEERKMKAEANPLIKEILQKDIDELTKAETSISETK